MSTVLELVTALWFAMLTPAGLAVTGSLAALVWSYVLVVRLRDRAEQRRHELDMAAGTYWTRRAAKTLATARDRAHAA